MENTYTYIRGILFSKEYDPIFDKWDYSANGVLIEPERFPRIAETLDELQN